MTTDLKEKITDKTKAIIVVNLFGNMARMDLLEKICLEKDIYLIEDAAESLGSKYQGQRSGSFGVGSVLSRSVLVRSCDFRWWDYSARPH